MAKHRAHGFCNTHLARYQRHGDPTVVAKPGWKAGTRWTTTVTYRAMHRRMDAVYGSARTYRCVDCGSIAAHWSYTGDDPAELLSTHGCKYSVYPEFYTPRCVPCHWAHDKEQRALAVV